MELEVVPYYDKPDRLTIEPMADGVRITAIGNSMQMTNAVARSLAYRLLAIAEYTEGCSDR